MGTTFLWFENGSSKPIQIHQLKACLINLNQWKCNAFRFLLCVESLEKRSHSESNHAQSGRGEISTTAVQTQRLTWTLTDICGSIFKGKETERRERERKRRRVLATHTHNAMCSCMTTKFMQDPRDAQSLSTQLYLHPKTTHASRGTTLPLHYACIKRAELHICPERHPPGIR